MTVPTDAPLAAVWLWLDTGSADEEPRHAGVAHFLEHMLFKGTPGRGLGVASGLVERGGGDLNAFTTWDHTVLHATVRGDAWELAVDVLADLARNPLLDAEELVREREVVLDEIRSYDEEVGSAVHDALRAELYRGHPYGRPVLGVADTVSRLDRDAVHAYWSRHWTADRALLVCAGPITPSALEAAATRHLGGWRRGPGRVPIAEPAPLPRSRALRLTHPFESAEVQIGWQAPGLDHPDLHALSLAASVLGQGSASLLAVELQLEEGLVGDATASIAGSPVNSCFTIGFAPTEGETAEALVASIDLVERVRRGAIAGSRIARSRDGMLAQLWFDHETVDGLAGDAAWYTARYGSPDAAEAHRRLLAAVQPDEVVAAAQRWLDPERAVVVVADPDLAETTLPRAWRKARAPRATPRPTGEPTVTRLESGARIVVLPDRGRVAAIQLGVLGGALAVGPRAGGMPAAWSELVQSGCGPWDAVAYRQRVDDLSAAVGAGCTASTWSLWASFPASELEDGVALLGEALLDPHFDREEWDRVQLELLDELRTLNDRPGEVAARTIDELLWDGHPWALPYVGTIGSVNRLTPTAIRKWHDAHLDPSRLVVAICGGVEPDWAIDVATSWLEELKPAAPLAPRAPARAPERRAHVRRAGRQQATVIAAVPTGPMDHPDRLALALAATVLDGPSGRLFLDLRERRSLGYDVWADHRTGLDGGALQLGVSCAPERVDEARDALIGEIRRLQDDGPTLDELDRCRALLHGDLAGALQRASGRASHLVNAFLFDRPWRAEDLARERAAVTPDHVRGALARVSAADPVVLTVRPR